MCGETPQCGDARPETAGGFRAFWRFDSGVMCGGPWRLLLSGGPSSGCSGGTGAPRLLVPVLLSPQGFVHRQQTELKRPRERRLRARSTRCVRGGTTAPEE